MLLVSGASHADCIGLGDPHVSAMPQLEYVLKGLKKRQQVGLLESGVQLPLLFYGILDGCGSLR